MWLHKAEFKYFDADHMTCILILYHYFDGGRHHYLAIKNSFHSIHSKFTEILLHGRHCTQRENGEQTQTWPLIA